MRVSIHTFIHQYIHSNWADSNQILSESSLGWGKGCMRFWARSDQHMVSMATDSSHRVILEKFKRNILLWSYEAQSFYILYVAMLSNPPYKPCLPYPWGPNWPCSRDVIICHRVKIGQRVQIFFSETTRPNACIFSMQQCLVVPYINPANCPMGPKWLHPGGVISSYRLTIWKLKKIS